MIIYKYKIGERECELHLQDDGPTIMSTDTEYNDAYFFVEYILKSIINKYQNNNFIVKRVLDVGMGNGNVLQCVRELLDVDVFGIDINNYLNSNNYHDGRTFVNMDICDFSKELLGTFDIAYQRLFSVPFKDTSKVLLAISRTLKPNGLYVVTFDDEEYEHEESFVIDILKEMYNHVTVKKIGNSIKSCVASDPRINPILKSMDHYYYTLNNEEYSEYVKADKNTQKQLLLTKKNAKL